MHGLAVTVRLLDHYTLISKLKEISENALRLIGKSNQNRRVYEQNPMLGHRGCRLGIFQKLWNGKAIFDALSI